MPIAQERLKFFAQFIEKEIGIIYADTNYFQLEHRLSDIVTLLGLKSLDELWEKAKYGIAGQMRDLILDVATNNETSFFRDALIFKGLTTKIVPEVLALAPQTKKIRIWSAASSTGQEAYSCAMAMEIAKQEKPDFPDYEIFVTDISERVLKRCQEGYYTQLEVQRGLPAKLLIQFFDNEGENKWRVKSALRDKLQFQKLNLLSPFPPLGDFDLILCRNVLIYQAVENKKQVVGKMAKCLSSKRYLVLGSAESMLGVSDEFNQVYHETAVFYQKKI